MVTSTTSFTTDSEFLMSSGGKRGRPIDRMRGLRLAAAFLYCGFAQPSQTTKKFLLSSEFEGQKRQRERAVLQHALIDLEPGAVVRIDRSLGFVVRSQEVVGSRYLLQIS